MFSLGLCRTRSGLETRHRCTKALIQFEVVFIHKRWRETRPSLVVSLASSEHHSYSIWLLTFSVELDRLQLGLRVRRQPLVYYRKPLYEKQDRATATTLTSTNIDQY